jgi:hypothetical protein
LPNATPVLLPGGEHFGPLEQPEQLVEQIRAFCTGAPVPRIARPSRSESAALIRPPLVAESEVQA